MGSSTRAGMDSQGLTHISAGSVLPVSVDDQNDAHSDETVSKEFRFRHS
jgi:hypothetical protein